MARTKPRRTLALQSSFEEIGVSRLRGISIHFPDDVYLLAVWVATSDKARSTPTRRPGTTLHGLAAKFASAYGIDYQRPLSSDDVMAVFRAHGLAGNPVIRFDQDIAESIVER